MPIYYFYAAVAVYYFLHSILALDQVKKHLSRNLIPAKWYRIGYNIVSAMLLLPLYWLYRKSYKEMILSDDGLFMVLGAVLLLVGLLLNFLAIRQYNLSEFSGTFYLREEATAKEEHLVRSGLNALVRHPLYLAALLIFWGFFLLRPNSAALGMAIITNLYLLVGIRLEERKLVHAFGDAYRQYQREVPMLLPRLLPNRK